MCEVALATVGMVIDDIVPGHTGKGAGLPAGRDEDRGLPRHLPHGGDPHRTTGICCPRLRAGRDSINLDYEAEDQLSKFGYIIGQLQRVIFDDPGVKDTNWSVTAPDHGSRRAAAPLGLPALLQGGSALDQLARSRRFAGMRLVIGDALHSLGDLGSGALGWTPTGSSGWRRARRARRPGRRDTRCRRRRTS